MPIVAVGVTHVVGPRIDYKLMKYVAERMAREDKGNGVSLEIHLYRPFSPFSIRAR